MSDFEQHFWQDSWKLWKCYNQAQVNTSNLAKMLKDLWMTSNHTPSSKQIPQRPEKSMYSHNLKTLKQLSYVNDQDRILYEYEPCLQTSHHSPVLWLQIRSKLH